MLIIDLKSFNFLKTFILTARSIPFLDPYISPIGIKEMGYTLKLIDFSVTETCKRDDPILAPAGLLLAVTSGDVKKISGMSTKSVNPLYPPVNGYVHWLWQ